MSGRVDHRPKLRESVVFSLASLAEVAGNMAGFQPGGINGRQLRLLVDQPSVASLCDDGIEQAGDEMFFNSRFSA